MRTSVVLVFATLLAFGQAPARAQNITIDRDQPGAFTGRPPIRVQESFTVLLANAGDPGSSNLDQAIASARQDLYRRIQQECVALGQSFSADCRIASFSISIARNFAPVANSAVSVVGASLRSVDASASYELKLKD